ncbi:hypothetical protein CJ195_14460 [Bacillus sp. UMB0899]|nr:hypothetical protein CJ195_14460 [Bacillus sp. UMB0899]
MRIFFVLDYLGGKGGVETVVSTVVKSLEEKGHDTYVFLPEKSADSTWEEDLSNVYYYCENKNAVSSELEVISERSIGLASLFHELRLPDVVVATHTPYTALYSRIALGYNKNIPLVSWLHNPPERFHHPQFINYADMHWAISKGIKCKIEEIVLEPKKTYWIGNPLNLEVPRLSVDSNQHYVFVGRLENRQKRLDILFKALAKVKHRWTLDIYGSGPDEEMLRNLALSLGINKCIGMKGWVDSPWKDIKNITALVLTSDFEGFGMVVGEALSRGVPVISTDSEGPRDLITHDSNGWIVPLGGITELIETFNKVSNLSNSELNQISVEAMQSVEDFSIDQVLNRMKYSLSDFISNERWNF